MADGATAAGPLRDDCEVLSNRRFGAYFSITLVAPEIAERARPGQFIEVAVPRGRENLLRRPFSIHRASRRGGWAGTLEIIFDIAGPGTEWLSQVRPHDTVDVLGPIGRPFQLPGNLTRCVLVGGGYGSAPLYFLAEDLKARGNQVWMVMGARSHDRILKPVEAKRLATSVVVTTEDGTMGQRGRVTDVLSPVLDRSDAEVVYACGPNQMLRAVARTAGMRRLPCQVAVEELMGCGLGICWTCVVPFLSADGRGWWNVRTCVEGPVFNASRIWWDRWLGKLASAPRTEPKPRGGQAPPATGPDEESVSVMAGEAPPTEGNG